MQSEGRDIQEVYGEQRMPAFPSLLSHPAFISRGYYVPMVLANGVDFCQIDFSGSMSFKDHIKGYMSYWYKKGRPIGADPLGIVRIGYSFISDKGPVEIGEFSQRFDTHTGRLLTRVSMYQLEMEIETILTSDHALMELFRIVACSNPQGVLRLDMNFRDNSYTNKSIRSLSSVPGALAVEMVNGVPSFRYRYSDSRSHFEGMGICGIRPFQKSTPVTHQVMPSDWPVPEIHSSLQGLKPGDCIARITTLLDSMDVESWEDKTLSIHQKYMTKDLSTIQDEHLQEWSELSNASHFSCDQKDVAAQFDTSLYVCKASLHPNGSTVTCLEIPHCHAMGTFWDIWFIHGGLLRANRLVQAEQIIHFWDMAYPEACRVAKDYHGLQGARYAWTLELDGTPWTYADQIHNNLIPVLTIWDQYAYTGNVDWIKDRFDLMQACVRFVIQYAVQRDEQGHYHLRELISVDESLKKKRNELVTAVATRKAIARIKQAAGVIGRPVDRDILSAEFALEQILSDLTVNGVYQAYTGADVGTWATMIAHIHYPRPDMFAQAAAFSLDGCRESHGLGIGKTSRMRCATFPWVEGIFAWAMALNDDPRAFEYLQMMNRYTNYFGGISEYIWAHGEPSREWFVAAHGVFVLVLCELCVRMENDRLQMFPLGLDSLPWETVTFRNFRVPGGLLVSCDYQKGKRVSLQVQNTSASSVELNVGIGKRYEMRVTVKPNEVFSNTLDL